MSLKLFNSLTRKKEEFVPIKENEVSLYTCGPTVYNYVHIGNLRAFVTYDLFRRFLEYSNFKVKHVMNLTDIDDKTIRDSQKEGKTLIEFTEFYTNEFIKDIKNLNIKLPHVMPKATEEINKMVDIIQVLLDKGYAYKVENGDIYFKIFKFPNYGALANLDLNNLKDNADNRLSNADEYEKENAKDFALWKAWDESDGKVFWETKIGKGRPGWHIECSAMAEKYLGQPFDIHMGGIDLIFPHHTNELAQSEAAFNKKFCNYWVHNEHLLVNGKKMSKSLGNFFTLRDLVKKGYNPIAIRYVFLNSHYRMQLNFTEDSIKAAESTIERFENFIYKLVNPVNIESRSEVIELINKVEKDFLDHLNDDLNTPEALASIFDFIRDVNKIELNKEDSDKILSLLKKFNSVLGIIDFSKFEKQEISKEVLDLVEKRDIARKEKNWQKSDEIRGKLKEMGIELMDTPAGTKIRKTN